MRQKRKIILRDWNKVFNVSIFDFICKIFKTCHLKWFLAIQHSGKTRFTVSVTCSKAVFVKGSPWAVKR
jgi:hypothetical protein